MRHPSQKRLSRRAFLARAARAAGMLGVVLVAGCDASTPAPAAFTSWGQAGLAFSALTTPFERLAK